MNFIFWNSKNIIILIGFLLVGFLIILLTTVYFLNKTKKELQIKLDENSKLIQIRDQYIQIIAHDIRSPLYAMQGMYELVKNAIRTKRYDDLEKVSNFIDETGIKTKNLLDNLLNWGMSQQEYISYNPQKLNIRQSIDEVISIYEATKVLKMLSININCSSDKFVYADNQGFQLILRNLIDNAIKNLPPKGIIDIVVSSDDNNRTTILIRDNGKGIDKEKLELINDVFKEPLSASLGQNGLGLGIILIGKFVQHNKGFITAQSTPNHGSCFTLTLPQP